MMKFLLFGSIVFARESNLAVVDLKQGSFKGIERSHSFTFYGIPYAEPPLGDLRFRKPIPVQQVGNSTSLFDATQPGNACFPKFNARGKISEDCLNLNIFTPKNSFKKQKKETLDKPLPVLVYLFGSGFAFGNDIMNISPLKNYPLSVYDGDHILNEFADSVVIVSVSYRLGPFGFLASKQVQEDGSLNAGLYDVAEALRWIKANINEFGGDGTQITVVGQSAGGMLVGGLLMMKDGTQELFQRGIMMSGPVSLNYFAPDFYQSSFDAMTSSVNCSLPTSAQVMACLRGVNATLLSEASQDMIFNIYADGLDIKQDSMSQMRKGRFSKVPIIINSNQDETSTFNGPLVNILTPGSLLKGNKTDYDFLQSLFIGGILDEQQMSVLHNIYNITTSVSPILSSSTMQDLKMAETGRLIGDLFVKCSSAFQASVFSKFGVPVYSSRFNHIPFLLKLITKRTEAFHGADALFFWQAKFILSPIHGEWRLANRITGSYIRFAQGLHPSKNPEEWSLYSNESKNGGGGIGNRWYVMDKGEMQPDIDLDSPVCTTLFGLVEQHFS